MRGSRRTQNSEAGMQSLTVPAGRRVQSVIPFSICVGGLAESIDKPLRPALPSPEAGVRYTTSFHIATVLVALQ